MTADFPGVQFRDQDVRFDVTPGEALAANTAQRGRLLATLHGLSDVNWAHESRCAGWSVQHVVRHLAQMNDLIADAITAALAGERFDAFKTFDPRTTPDTWVQARHESPAGTLGIYDNSSTALMKVIDGLDADGTLLVATPAGRQPWPRALLHALFDSAIHERDILEPLGVEVAADADELSAIAAYQVLLAARVACLAGLPLDVTLRLDGADTLSVAIDAAVVDVHRDAADGGEVATGSAVAVLDAMAGRGDLDAVLTGSPVAVTALSTLRALL
jgi:uncharacterized protein (TIGR03083 family)